MRKLLPGGCGAISYVQVPPNGSLGSAMRTTSFDGGSAVSVSNGIAPLSSVSTQAGSPCRSGGCWTLFNPCRHDGIASILVMVFQMTSGGWRKLASRVTVCSFGSRYPITVIKIRNPASATKIQRIHFMQHLANTKSVCSAKGAADRVPSSCVCPAPPFARSRRGPEAPSRELPLPADRASAEPTKHALAQDRGPTLLPASALPQV